ncbi:hypothetical protein CVT25_000992 [Psilocybe cyanescens]|uniref:Uncharacterized protein n=1 Tax=Psilocybe cyanescens TaxID=93625 RepID=A0A409XML5_PSICY|nr:hypothetical protein CVT25_000992 [Psilocybe cyanescens]
MSAYRQLQIAALADNLRQPGVANIPCAENLFRLFSSSFVLYKEGKGKTWLRGTVASSTLFATGILGPGVHHPPRGSAMMQIVAGSSPLLQALYLVQQPHAIITAATTAAIYADALIDA